MLTERPHIINLPKFGKGQSTHVEYATPNPRQVAQQWITKLESALASKDASRLQSIMHADCWWRDHLTFQWDFHTIHGLDKLIGFVGGSVEAVQPSNFKLHQSGKFAPRLTKPIDGMEWIESMFTFETKTGRGSGYLRIVQGPDGIWKGYMVYTVLKELKGFEETVGRRRAHGGNNSLLGGTVKGNWQERRDRQKEFVDEEPQVLIIGAGEEAKVLLDFLLADRSFAGQAGLNVAARLQAIGVSCLIVDKNKRIGDNWRLRYRVSILKYARKTRHGSFMIRLS